MKNIKNIIVIGTGYVGLVTGTCFAELGHKVTCVDIDKVKIDSLKKGMIPIYEPGLKSLIKKNYEIGNLQFTSNLNKACADSHFIFIAVGTPTTLNGHSDTSFVFQAALDIGKNLSKDGVVIVNKSTVPVGTAQKVTEIIQRELSKRMCSFEYSVVSNPEFLKEGSAVKDFFNPDRIIIGSEDSTSCSAVRELYLSYIDDQEKILLMGVKEAELTKYISNAMLATKISFINEVACLCEVLEVDINQVKKGVGTDSRIGKDFISPGCGYGGSCFPKDIKELIHMSYKNGISPSIFEAVNKRNDLQKHLLFEKVRFLFGDNLDGVKIALWGLAFKPETNDMREAPSLSLIKECCKRGAHIVAYDPVASDTAKKAIKQEDIISTNISYSNDQYQALKGADLLILQGPVAFTMVNRILGGDGYFKKGI